MLEHVSIPDDTTISPRRPSPSLLWVIAMMTGLKNKASSSGCATIKSARLDFLRPWGKVRELEGNKCPSRRKSVRLIAQKYRMILKIVLLLREKMDIM